jgi:hypothetical protein
MDAAVAINGKDNAILWLFRCFLRQVSTQEEFIPPEYGQGTSGQRELPVRPERDVFHLGMWFWLVAWGHSAQTSNLFYRAVGCPLVAYNLPCHESHTDPIELPRLDPGIPTYFQEIVSACRQAGPRDRLPVWRLLEMFQEARVR